MTLAALIDLIEQRMLQQLGGSRKFIAGSRRCLSRPRFAVLHGAAHRFFVLVVNTSRAGFSLFIAPFSRSSHPAPVNFFAATSRGIPHSRRRVCAPSRADATALLLRSSSSCGFGIRASSSANAGWVEMYAWAWENLQLLIHNLAPLNYRGKKALGKPEV